MRSKRAAEPHQSAGEGSSDSSIQRSREEQARASSAAEAPSADVSSSGSGAPPSEAASAPSSSSSPPKSRARRSSPPDAAKKKRDKPPSDDKSPGAAMKRARGATNPATLADEQTAAEATSTSSGGTPSSAEPARAWTTTRESNVPGGVMPYVPSAPCAACARGVDPLRAACISITEHSVHYFCSRSCQQTFLRAETEHEQRLIARAARASAPAPSSQARVGDAGIDETAPITASPRRTAPEPVAQRVAPAKPSTPRWPLIGAALCAIASFVPVAGAAQLGAFALLGLAIVFASRTVRTRREGGPLAWLAGPLALGLLGLAALLGPGSFEGGRPALAAACAGIVLLWLREHLLERVMAARRALHTELSSWLSTRVQVDRLRIGDELLCEAGSVIPVDGIISEGVAEVLPYPRARRPLERTRGAAVLAGALVVSGALRVRAQRIGERRALFAMLGETTEPTAHDSRALRIADHARSLQGGLVVSASVLVVALLSPQPAAAKLAGAAAALLALPALALACGLRSVFRAAVVGAAARGVRFRDAAILERAGRVDTAVLRVEGVLVPRVYTLLQVVSLSDTHDATALLALALAAGSTAEPSKASGPQRDAEPHAIARAVREHAQQLGVEPAVLRRIALARGLGVTGLTDGQGPLVFGSRAALLAAGVSVAVADGEAQRAESSGQRVVFLALGGRVRGLLLFAQTVRSEARAAVQTLFDLGLELTLVSGDHGATVDSIARRLDITQFKAELSAEQRAAEVERLCDGEAHVVALGLAPADEAMLTSAGLSLCLDAAGQPHHHEAGQAVAYDITTATDDLRDAAAALVLARRARRALWRVLATAALGLAAGLLGAAGLVPPLVVVLIAAAVDLVCLNTRPGFADRRWGAAGTREDAAA